MKFNMDQVISLGNHALGLVAALLLSWGLGGDVVDLMTGIFASIMTLSIGIWMNSDNVFDAVQSVMRKTLMMVGVFAAGRGWISAETGTMIVGGVMGILPVVWSMLFYRDAPGPNFPGTTIVDPIKTVTAGGTTVTTKPAITDPAKVEGVRDATAMPPANADDPLSLTSEMAIAPARGNRDAPPL